MIIRVWHGRTSASTAKQYHDFILLKGIGDYKQTQGNIDAFLVQQQEGEETHIWTVSHWKDWKSIENFAGRDIAKAKYYEEDKKYLLEFEPAVHHHETSGGGLIYRLMVNDIIELYGGGGWYGESFCDKLKEITDETAFKRPLGKFHSVAEILWHCTYWRRSVVNQLLGTLTLGASMESEENWLPILTLRASGWKKLLALFQRSQIDLVDQLLKTSEEDLHREYKPGETLLYLIKGIKHHDIYHLGQIGLVKRLIG